jgi:chaperonin cofactor prefoldin
VANSATVGILRALLVADTAEFEQGLSDATKQVAKLSDATGEYGTAIAAALDTSTDKWTAFQQKWNVGPMSDATTTLAKDVGGLGTTLTQFGLRAAEFATGTLAAQVALDAFKFVLRDVVPYLLEFTGLGPAIEDVWGHMKEGASRALGVLDDVGAEFRDLTDDMLTGLVPGLEKVGGAAGLAKLGFDAWLDVEVLQKLRDVKEFVEGLHKEWNMLRAMMGNPVIPTPVAPEGTRGPNQGAATAPTMSRDEQRRIEQDLADDLRERNKERAKAAREEAAAVEKAAKAWEAHNKALRDAGRALSQSGVTDQMVKLETEVGLAIMQFGGLSQKAIPDVVKQTEAWVRAGLPLPPLLVKIRDENIGLVSSLIPVTSSIKGLVNLTPNLAPGIFEAQDATNKWNKELDAFNHNVGGPSGVINLVKGWQSIKLQPPPNVLADWKGAFTQLARDGVQLLTYGLQSGDWASVGQSIGALVGGGFSKAFGEAAKAAGAAGEIALSAGTAFAGFWFTGFFNALGANERARSTMTKWHNQMEQLKADLVGPTGVYANFTELEEKANSVGMSFVELWNTKAAVPERLQHDIDELNKRLATLQKIQDQVKGKFDGLTSALTTFGGVVPASLRPAIDELLRIGGPGLTDQLRAGLEGLAKDPSWQTLQSKAETLGIDLAALGPQFQQAKLSDIAFGYQHDLQMFADSGADMSKVLKGMADELSNVYKTAKETGAKLPDTLKPWMQKLVDAGLLVDESGKKIDHLDDSMFADIQDTGLTAVVDILKDIRDLLEKALPEAARKGAAGIQAAFGFDLSIPYHFSGPSGSGMPIPDMPDSPKVNNPGAGSAYDPFGGEAVAHPTDLDFSDSSAINLTVVSQLDGKEVARNQVRYLPRTLQLAGL